MVEFAGKAYLIPFSVALTRERGPLDAGEALELWLPELVLPSQTALGGLGHSEEKLSSCCESAWV